MKLSFIGGGNMAAAMIGGLRGARAGSEAAPQILVVERDAARRAYLQAQMGVRTQAAVDEALADSAIVVLAVKPGDIESVCRELAPLSGGFLVLSIAAGIPSSAIARWCAREAVVRAMPNTPALIGQGITGVFARAAVTPAQRQAALVLLQGLGETVWLAEEDMLDAVTAISGSGPAYVFYFIEALQQAASQMGMDSHQARRFAVQTFVGAAQLAAQSTEDLALLRERVTSKGGTTAAALAKMQADQVGNAITQAAFAALARSREMARQYDSEKNR